MFGCPMGGGPSLQLMTDIRSDRSTQAYSMPKSEANATVGASITGPRSSEGAG